MRGSWLCLLLVGCASPEPEGLDPRFEETLRWTEARMGEWNVPGVAIAVVEDGELRHLAGLGFRELGSLDPVDTETLFRVGSISKMVTGALVVQAVDDGLLDLEEPASAWLPGVTLADPDTLDTVTLGQLLAHGSGLQPRGVPNQCSTTPDGVDEVLLGDAADWELWLPPETLWNYANGGYVLAGAAVARARSEPFESLAQEGVFEPLGLVRATYHPTEAWGLGNVAMGHALNAETRELVGFRDLDDRACAATFPSGGLMLDIEGLGRLAEMLLSDGGSVLDADQFDDFSSGGWEFGGDAGYNHGLLRTDYRGHTSFTHGGTVGGYLTHLEVLPELGLGVAVMVNADHPTVFPPEPRSNPDEVIALHLLDAFLGLEPEPWVDNSRAPEEWSRYVGRYHSAHGWGTLEVELDGDELVLTEVDGDVRRELSPYSRDRFYFERVSGTDGRPYTSQVKFVQEDDETRWLVSGAGIAERVDDETGDETGDEG